MLLSIFKKDYIIIVEVIGIKDDTLLKIFSYNKKSICILENKEKLHRIFILIHYMFLDT